MIVIGELINGMYKDVGKAIANKESDVIQHLAQDQVRAGATVLDVNTGPYSKNPKDDMKWLVETIQSVVQVPLALDSTKADVIEEGLKLVTKRAIINSTNADEAKMETIFGLAKKYNAQVIGLAMDKSGVPNNKEKRLELAATIVAKAMEFEVSDRRPLPRSDSPAGECRADARLRGPRIDKGVPGYCAIPRRIRR